jgi:hypothetical protein
MAEMYRYARQRSERAQIELLSHRLVGIVRPGTDQRGKIFDFDKGIFWEQQLAEPANIDPPIRSLLQSAVVEIEPVDIDVRSDERPPEMQKPP